MLNIPDTFKMSSRCPSIEELQALHTFLSDYKIFKNVLEFGCGVTSYTVAWSITYKTYTAVEQYPLCIQQAIQHVPRLTVVDTWDKIPDMKYDLLFVDGSTGYPKDLKPLIPLPQCNVPFRNDAIHYVKDKLTKDCIIILHDWNHTWDYQMPRRYLENNNYELIWSCNKGKGLGCYIK